MFLFLNALIFFFSAANSQAPGIYVALNNKLLSDLEKATASYIDSKLYYNKNLHSDYKHGRCMDTGEHYTIFHRIKYHTTPEVSMKFRGDQQDILVKVEISYLKTDLKLYNEPTFYYWLEYFLIHMKFHSLSISLQISPKVNWKTGQIFLDPDCSASVSKVKMNFKGIVGDIYRKINDIEEEAKDEITCFICPIIKYYFTKESDQLLPSSTFSYLKPTTLKINTESLKVPKVVDNQLLVYINGYVTANCKDYTPTYRLMPDVPRHSVGSGQVNVQINEGVFNSVLYSFYECRYLQYTYAQEDSSSYFSFMTRTLRKALPILYRKRPSDKFKLRVTVTKAPFVEIAYENFTVHATMFIEILMDNETEANKRIITVASTNMESAMTIQPYISGNMFYATVKDWKSTMFDTSRLQEFSSKSTNENLENLFDTILSFLVKPWFSNYMENNGCNIPQYFKGGNDNYVKSAKLYFRSNAAILSMDFKNLIKLVKKFY